MASDLEKQVSHIFRDMQAAEMSVVFQDPQNLRMLKKLERSVHTELSESYGEMGDEVYGKFFVEYIQKFEDPESFRNEMHQEDTMMFYNRKELVHVLNSFYADAHMKGINLESVPEMQECESLFISSVDINERLLGTLSKIAAKKGIDAIMTHIDSAIREILPNKESYINYQINQIRATNLLVKVMSSTLFEQSFRNDIADRLPLVKCLDMVASYLEKIFLPVINTEAEKIYDKAKLQ